MTFRILAILVFFGFNFQLKADNSVVSNNWEDTAKEVFLSEVGTKKNSVCPVEVDENVKAECGVIKVPENHDKPSSKKGMAVGYIFIPSTNPESNELLVIEQGGPGWSSIALASVVAASEPKLLSKFNILGVDQRGTKWTYPSANCIELNPPLKELLADQTNILGSDEDLEVKRTVKCLDKISKQIDINSINSYQISNDIPYVVSSLGYDQFSFYGVSYGTAIGQYLTVYHSSMLKRVVLDSPVVLDEGWTKKALDGLPKLIDYKINSLVEHLNQNNSEVTDREKIEKRIKDKISKLSAKPIDVKISSGNQHFTHSFNGIHYFSILIRFLLMGYDMYTVENFLLAVDLKSLEDIERDIVRFIDFDSNSVDAMHRVIMCREFPKKDFKYSDSLMDLLDRLIPFDTAGIIRNTKSSSVECIPLKKLKTIPKQLGTKFKSDSSVLIVGGELDHVTKPINVSIVKENYSNGKAIVFKGLPHGVMGSNECATETILSFLTEDKNFSTDKCETMNP